jgi:parvulin-like peptidyl-prolyl isomerase
MHRSHWIYPTLLSFASTGIFLACAAAKSPKDAENSPGNTESPGAQCLAAAGAERTPQADAPATIEVSHILVRHKELTRSEGSTLNREEACLKALAALEALNSSTEWNDAVEQFSDSGKSNHGSLGTISRDDVTIAFGNAAFELAVNELSYVVESDRGFHVIWRTR